MNIIQADWLKKPGVEKITRLLSDAGFEIYFVGGCVRNTLLNRPVDDIDLASNARPDQIQNLARAAKLKTIPTGIEHGTITVISEGTPYEITTFRQDIET
ncbi:MAG: CCA tRNA nucleotidyltransferase, partial [Rhodobacteraceae bacterium]|nr:CCA tRNA nucleotidyltransferase [Paracoccaceae bacterium]